MNELARFRIEVVVVTLVALLVMRIIIWTGRCRDRRRHRDEVAADKIMAQFGRRMLRGEVQTVEEVVAQAPRSMKAGVRLACYTLLAFQEVRNPLPPTASRHRRQGGIRRIIEQIEGMGP